MTRTVLRGGTVADGSGAPEALADVVIVGGMIAEVGEIAPQSGDVEIDCSSRVVLPGLIDAHSHSDAAVFDLEVASALLRQGVTTVIVGQDGVSFAPGDGTYATEYFAALNGSHPTYRGGGVGKLLATYDSKTPLNVGYLVPHGTVRHEVMGGTDRPATQDELRRMQTMISVGLAEGALGLSTGLDYAPGYFADTAELIAVAEPVAACGALYVSHLRGGYEDNIGLGLAEISQIAQATGVSVHVSHLHGPWELIQGSLASAVAAGVDLSFDAYPYRRGCSLLAMPMVPPALLRKGTREAARQLADPQVRAAVIRDWLPVMVSRPDMGPRWAAGITIAGVQAPADRWAQGRTVAEAAVAAGLDAAEFGLRLIADSQLAVSAVFRVPLQRPVAELARIFTHEAHLGGSDGIYLGGHPHPRGWGAFARFLGRHVRERADYSWATAAVHLSSRTAARHGLADRGRIAPGYVADVLVLDPATVADRADYDHPREPAVGIDDVFVGGTAVLRSGRETGVDPGQGLRRSASARPMNQLRGTSR